MRSISEVELKKQISTGDFAPVYFICGNESYFIRRYVNRIIDKAVSGEKSFNLNTFDDSLSLQNLYDALSQLPLMSDRKCVSVCDYSFWDRKIEEFEQFLDVLSDSYGSTVLIFWYDVLTVNLKSEKVKKVLKAIEKNGGVTVTLNHKSNQELVGILCKGAAKRGCRMEPTTARYLLETCSDDFTTLINELEKICAYVETGNITKEIIDKVSFRSVDVKVFDLSNAIIAGNAQGAMVILDDLFFMKVDPIIILSTLSNAYVDIYKAKCVLSNGYRVDNVAEELGYKSNVVFRLRNAAGYSKRLSDVQIRLCFDVLIETDRKVKGFILDPKTVLEEAIIKLLYISSKGVSV